MAGAQMILVIGGILLLSFLSLNVNRAIKESTESTLQSECILTANAIASEILNEVKSKAYDEAAVSASVEESNIPSSFTLSGSLGPDGEAYPAFDDVDDFNGFSRNTNTTRLGNFSANVTVNYVSTDNPDISISSKTRVKRIKVAVTNAVLADTLKLFYYSSY